MLLEKLVLENSKPPIRWDKEFDTGLEGNSLTGEQQLNT